MSFVIYDLTFLVVFSLAVTIFLYTRRSNLKRQGILYLYRTNIGIKIMDYTSKKFGKILRPLQYFIVACGYALMGVMIYLLVVLVKLYTSNEVVRQTKIPPVLPLVPYLPDLFKVDFLPPFYFTYWILIIAVVAITHEFAHGIFARLNDIKVHSTGFGFLGPFLAAFVEPDEKSMAKAKKFPQLAILAAGTFANVLVTIFFGIVLWIFFALAFTPAGVIFNSYATSAVNLSDISSINGLPVAQGLQNVNESLSRIITPQGTFFVPGTNLKGAYDSNVQAIVAYEDTPAFNSDLRGAIVSIDGNQIRGHDDLRAALEKLSPGDTVEVVTASEEGTETKSITLGNKNGVAYLGVGFLQPNRGKVIGRAYSVLEKIRDPFVYYKPKIFGDFSFFIYDLLWWMVLINISVALMNMLPVGIFDGGKFFYLTIWGITGREKAGKYAYAIATYAILGIFIWMTLRWIVVFF